MNISCDSCRIFYYAAKYQNFTQAADRLMNSQPNVTRAIKNLEGALGCRLFLRSNCGVRLTPEGEKLYSHIAPAVEHIRADGLPKGLSQRRVKDIQEMPVCGEAFSFLKGRTLSLEELIQYPLIGLGPDTVPFRFFSRFFSRRQLPFRLDIETAAADQILPFVREGLGIGFVPEEVLQEQPSSAPVQVLSLEEPIPKRSILLLNRERQALSAAARKLNQMMIP